MARYCSNCGNLIPENGNFCTNCGKRLKRQTPDIPWVRLGLVMIACVAAFFSLCVVAYDSKEILWLHEVYGKSLIQGEGIQSGYAGCVYCSLATVLTALLAGVKNFSKPGNMTMLIGSLITFTVAFQAPGADLLLIAKAYNSLLWLWFICAMVYGWTTLYQAFSAGLVNKAAPFVVCGIWTLVFLCFF